MEHKVITEWKNTDIYMFFGLKSNFRTRMHYMPFTKHGEDLSIWGCNPQ